MKKLSVEQMSKIEGGLTQRTSCIIGGAVTVGVGVLTLFAGSGNYWGTLAGIATVGYGAWSIQQC
jgi:hypothetical protein